MIYKCCHCSEITDCGEPPCTLESFGNIAPKRCPFRDKYGVAEWIKAEETLNIEEKKKIEDAIDALKFVIL